MTPIEFTRSDQHKAGRKEYWVSLLVNSRGHLCYKYSRKIIKVQGNE